MVKLRSAEWFAREGKYGFIPRSWMKAQGFGPEQFDGRPVIGICNTWSELTPCNRHLRDLAEHVKRGVIAAGGFPLEFPVTSLGEPLMRPTTMMFRNLAAMDVEETIRANPIDGVILLAGCDKTTPALLMGAASCDVPAILVSGGPMLNGRYRGQTSVPAPTFSASTRSSAPARSSKAEYRRRRSGDEPFGRVLHDHGHRLHHGFDQRSAGHCAHHQRRHPRRRQPPAGAVRAGRPPHRRTGRGRCPDVARSSPARRSRTPSSSMAPSAARPMRWCTSWRWPAALGVPFTLEDWDRFGRDVPTLVDLKPSGRFLMEEFYYAGGLPALMNRIGDGCTSMRPPSTASRSAS